MSQLLKLFLATSPVILGFSLGASAAFGGENLPSTQLENQASSTEAELYFETTPPVSVAQDSSTINDSSELLEQINQYDPESSDQVTDVRQLTDIDPFWFEAVEKMVNKYGCIVGYPDRTFKGRRNITRYEFAAAVSRCMEYVEGLGLGNVDDGTLESLRRLVREFEAELATLGTRVDDLEGRLAFVEDNQFSTTTKLQGEVIFDVADEFLTSNENETVLQDRVRLTLETSFTGKDRLYTRLRAGNTGGLTTAGDAATPSVTNSFLINARNFGGAFVRTAEGTRASEVFTGAGDNDVGVDWLAYYTPLPIFGGEENASRLYISAFGGIWSDIAPTLNPFFEDYDGGNGAISTFAQENPIYRIGGGAGAAVSFGVGLLESVLGPSTVTIGYLSTQGNNPTEGNGLFNGDYAALGQVNFNLGDRLGVGFTYVHSLHSNDTAIFDLGDTDINIDRGVVGTIPANFPHRYGGADGAVTNSYGAEIAYRLSENISFSGFFTYTDVILLSRGDSESWSYGAGLAIQDLGKEGNVLGIFGGAQPYAFSVNVNGNAIRAFGTQIPWHIEGFYKYQVSDNISITPGIIWLLNPDQGSPGVNSGNNALIGTLRTTFTF